MTEAPPLDDGPVDLEQRVTEDDFQLLTVAAEVARRASDGMLASLAALGVSAIAVAMIFDRWRLIPMALVVLSFGAWGIGDRADGVLHRFGRPLFAVIGLLSVVGTLLMVLFAALGTIIS